MQPAPGAAGIHELEQIVQVDVGVRSQPSREPVLETGLTQDAGPPGSDLRGDAAFRRPMQIGLHAVFARGTDQVTPVCESPR